MTSRLVESTKPRSSRRIVRHLLLTLILLRRLDRGNLPWTKFMTGSFWPTISTGLPSQVALSGMYQRISLQCAKLSVLSFPPMELIRRRRWSSQKISVFWKLTSISRWISNLTMTWEQEVLVKELGQQMSIAMLKLASVTVCKVSLVIRALSYPTASLLYASSLCLPTWKSISSIAW